MSKGIIVLNNIPEDCVSCRLLILSAYGGKFCKVVKEYTYTDKPDWCPIKPVPEKKAIIGSPKDIEESKRDLVRAGRDMCVDELLKGGENDA